MVPIQSCQLLLGRPWLYDHDVQIFGRTNKLALMYKGGRISLLPVGLKNWYLAPTISGALRGSTRAEVLDLLSHKHTSMVN